MSLIAPAGSSGNAGPRTFHVARGWVGGTSAANVVIEVERGIVSSVTTDRSAPADVEVLEGFVVPGLANTHSHAFHRALRGRTESEPGDFWSWRDLMYELAGRLDPNTYRELATAVFAEMALAGITTVGEFHYLHHPTEGGTYGDRNEMGLALVDSAARAGIRITLLDTCFLSAGFGEAPRGVQSRFSDGTAEAWVERVEALEVGEHAKVGAAIHSVRAVDRDAAATVAVWAAAHDVPLHFHLSEQSAENEACLETTGLTPTQFLESVGALTSGSTAVHATHLDDRDVTLLAGSGTRVCLCPTTERVLGDGIGPARRLVDAGVPLSLGSDSHAVIDLLEEARLVDLQERLVTGVRGGYEASDLLANATVNGARSLGWPDVGIEVGGLADFVAVDVESMRTAGIDDPVAAVVYGATADDVTTVVVGGEVVVRDGIHIKIADPVQSLDRVIRTLLDA